MTQDADDQHSAGTISDAPADGPTGNRGRGGLWRRTAGTAAVVAVLIVGNTATAQASARPVGRTVGVGSAGSAGSSAIAGSATAGSPLHGEFRVINRDGSAQLRRWQSGAVGAIDNLTLTVRSADGFDSTYLLGPGVSVMGIGVGDEVTVVGAGPAVPA